jgi:sulfite exporter TauE/SafE
MTPDLLIVVSAFLLGLLGSLHCIGMCGGIAGMLHAASATTPESRSPRRRWTMTLAYNGGRIASYMLAGAIAALIGVSLLGLLGRETGRNVAQLFSGLFMILLGLYLTGWWNALAPIERIGLKLWRRLSPVTRHLLPITGYGRAIAAGAIWGWLPCGLVYSALALVMANGKPLTGAIAMGVFGLGTLPVVAAVGMLSGESGLMRRPLVRKIAGSLIMLFGMAMFTGLTISHGAQPL